MFHPLFSDRLPRFFQRTLDKGVFRIHDGGLRVGLQQLLYPFRLFKPGCDDLVPVREPFHDLFYLLVVFQVFYRKVAGGIFVPDAAVLLKQQLDPVDALLQFRPVVHVDVAGEAGVIGLVDLYHGVEQLIDAFAAAAHGRDYRHSEQMPESPDVEPVPF